MQEASAATAAAGGNRGLEGWRATPPTQRTHIRTHASTHTRTTQSPHLVTSVAQLANTWRASITCSPCTISSCTAARPPLQAPCPAAELEPEPQPAPAPGHRHCQGRLHQEPALQLSTGSSKKPLGLRGGGGRSDVHSVDASPTRRRRSSCFQALVKAIWACVGGTGGHSIHARFGRQRGETYTSKHVAHLNLHSPHQPPPPEDVGAAGLPPVFLWLVPHLQPIAGVVPAKDGGQLCRDAVGAHAVQQACKAGGAGWGAGGGEVSLVDSCAETPLELILCSRPVERAARVGWAALRSSNAAPTRQASAAALPAAHLPRHTVLLHTAPHHRSLPPAVQQSAARTPRPILESSPAHLCLRRTPG